MDLERGTLARIDRKLLAGLSDDEAYRTVRLPVSEAVWSTWTRYCSATGIPIGRAVVARRGPGFEQKHSGDDSLRRLPIEASVTYDCIAATNGRTP